MWRYMVYVGHSYLGHLLDLVHHPYHQHLGCPKMSSGKDVESMDHKVFTRLE